MIFVTVGTHTQPFDRLVKAADEYAAFTDEEVVIQQGCSTYRCMHAKSFSVCSGQEMAELQARASVVVTQGGWGTMSECIDMGKSVVAVPRIEGQEHIHDQEQAVRKLEELGCVIGVYDIRDLSSAIEKAGAFVPKPLERGNGAQMTATALEELLQQHPNMKVINLLNQDFHLACERLALKVLECFCPDIIIGVLTGGGMVGREAMPTFESRCGCRYGEVKLQRGGTRIKEALKINRILRLLPEGMLNFMRVLEAEFLEFKANFTKPDRSGRLSIDEEIRCMLKTKGKRVLIIDDTMDTGWTLKIIKDWLEANFPGNEIKIAVISTTHRHSVAKADFQLYDRTLIRFPWAHDAKSGDS